MARAARKTSRGSVSNPACRRSAATVATVTAAEEPKPIWSENSELTSMVRPPDAMGVAAAAARIKRNFGCASGWSSGVQGVPRAGRLSSW